MSVQHVSTLSKTMISRTQQIVPPTVSVLGQQPQDRPNPNCGWGAPLNNSTGLVPFGGSMSADINSLAPGSTTDSTGLDQSLFGLPDTQANSWEWFNGAESLGLGAGIAGSSLDDSTLSGWPNDPFAENPFDTQPQWNSSEQPADQDWAVTNSYPPPTHLSYDINTDWTGLEMALPGVDESGFHPVPFDPTFNQEFVSGCEWAPSGGELMNAMLDDSFFPPPFDGRFEDVMYDVRYNHQDSQQVVDGFWNTPAYGDVHVDDVASESSGSIPELAAMATSDGDAGEDIEMVDSAQVTESVPRAPGIRSDLLPIAKRYESLFNESENLRVYWISVSDERDMADRLRKLVIFAYKCCMNHYNETFNLNVKQEKLDRKTVEERLEKRFGDDKYFNARDAGEILRKDRVLRKDFLPFLTVLARTLWSFLVLHPRACVKDIAMDARGNPIMWPVVLSEHGDLVFGGYSVQINN